MIWPIIYYPPSNKHGSPYAYILSVEVDEQSAIIHRLEFLSNNLLADWPHPWIHKITDNIFQLTAGKRSRIFYFLDDHQLIVVHACKKVAQKTRLADIEQAKTNCKEYLKMKDPK